MARLTQRDLEIARFLGRTKIARPAQVATRFDVSLATAYARLAFLVELGLADQADRVSPDGRVFFATAAGLAETGLALPPAQPTVGVVVHDLAATELIAELERRGVDCLAERELRAHRRDFKDDRYVFDVDDKSTGRSLRHQADIACEIPGRDLFFAIELELTRKHAQRWRDILWGYKTRVDVNGFGGVLYFTRPECRPSRLMALAHEVGLGSRFQLQLIDDADPLAGLLALTNAAAKK